MPLRITVERTNLTAFAKSCKKGGSWESQSSFKTIVSVKGAYPSCLTAMCSNTLPIFLRALTCSWCFSLLRPETVETTPESSDRLNPVYDKEKEVESTGQPKTVPEPSSFFANNNSSDPEWQGRDSLIGESEWYSSWGAATLVIASTKTNVTGKNRAADGGYDPFYDPLRITPRGERAYYAFCHSSVSESTCISMTSSRFASTPMLCQSYQEMRYTRILFYLLPQFHDWHIGILCLSVDYFCNFVGLHRVSRFVNRWVRFRVGPLRANWLRTSLLLRDEFFARCSYGSCRSS